ncbi:MAG: DMT family transporter [Puniceicoccaceae bacterium]|nr:MAG: DMT family transporter [Puniceicoccaceae bacterium]
MDPRPTAAPVPAGAGAALALSMLLWGSAFPAIRAGLEGFSPYHLALFRFLIASAITGVLCLHFRPKLPPARHWPFLILSSLSGIVLYTVFLNLGQLTVTAGSASFIISLVPVITAVLAPLLLKEAPPRGLWIGLGLSLTGIALISFGEGDRFVLSTGVFWVLAAAACGSATILLQKPVMRHCDSFSIGAWIIWIGTAALLVFLPGLPAAIEAAPPRALGATVYLGIFPGAVAYLCWAKALAAIPAGQASRMLFVIPVIAVAVAWLWLGEIPPPPALAGGFLVIAGLFWGRRRGPVPA